MKGFWILILLLLPSGIFAADFGFLEQNLWINPENFFSGDSVRVYSVVFNGSEDDIFGKVAFYAGKENIGEVDFSLAGGGRMSDVWIDWQATYGEREFYALISEAFRSLPGGNKETLAIAHQQSSGVVRFVDRDTDGDGIGDEEDADDDNDGILDGEDSDPLVANIKAEVEKPGVNNIKVPEFVPSGVQPAVAATGNFLEAWRQRSLEGLSVEKERVDFVLDSEAENWREGQRQAVMAQNNVAQDLNDASGEDFMRLRDIKNAAPPLSFQRILYLIYSGVIVFVTSIFKYRVLLYTLLLLIGLRIVWSLAKRVFKRT